MEHGAHGARPTEGTEKVDPAQRLDALVDRLTSLPDYRFVRVACMTFGGAVQTLKMQPRPELGQLAAILEDMLALDARMNPDAPRQP